MKKKNQPTGRQRKIQKKESSFPVIISLLLLFILLGTALFFLNKTSIKGKIASNEARQNLQIGTFPLSEVSQPTQEPTTPPSTKPPSPTTPSLPTPTTTPTTIFCKNQENGKQVEDPNCLCPAWMMKCINKQCADVNQGRSLGNPTMNCAYQGNQYPNWCGMPNMTGSGEDGWYCLDKPVIYLYPVKPTMVDVSVETPGKVVVSDPLYPENGWKNVLARPSGTLTYRGKDYSELFYESSVSDFKKPTDGITLTQNGLRKQLDGIIERLGLVGSEKTEFLDYWVPRLQLFNSPYIFFSVIDPQEKERIDHVIYKPEPNTRIEFIAYFKALDKPFSGHLLELPSTPPQRIGFTAVEWGGTIDAH